MCKITCCDCKETSLRGALIFVASMSLLLGVIFVILTLNILTSTPWYVWSGLASGIIGGALGCFGLCCFNIYGVFLFLLYGLFMTLWWVLFFAVGVIQMRNNNKYNTDTNTNINPKRFWIVLYIGILLCYQVISTFMINMYYNRLRKPHQRSWWLFSPNNIKQIKQDNQNTTNDPEAVELMSNEE
mmetsp:Transcript_3463/g.4259  ORF Transcript_3463/g.4259 Transcript_3463/m.4259 type:complete len:185 (+) Transcript_3463:66-620(+)